MTMCSCVRGMVSYPVLVWGLVFLGQKGVFNK